MKIPGMPHGFGDGDQYGQDAGDDAAPMSGIKVILIIAVVVAVVLGVRFIATGGLGGGGGETNATTPDDGVLTTWELSCESRSSTAQGKTSARLEVDLRRDDMGNGQSKRQSTQLMLNGVEQAPETDSGTEMVYEFPFGKYDDIVLTSAATDEEDCPAIHFTTGEETDRGEAVLPFDAKDTMKLHGTTKREVGLIKNGVPTRLYVEWGMFTSDGLKWTTDKIPDTVILAVRNEGGHEGTVELAGSTVRIHETFPLPILSLTLDWDSLDWENLTIYDGEGWPGVDLDKLEVDVDADGWKNTSTPSLRLTTRGDLEIFADMEMRTEEDEKAKEEDQAGNSTGSEEAEEKDVKTGKGEKSEK